MNTHTTETTTSYNLNKSIFPTNGVPKMCRWKGKQCRPRSDCSLEQSDLDLHFAEACLSYYLIIVNLPFRKKKKMLSQVVKNYIHVGRILVGRYAIANKQNFIFGLSGTMFSFHGPQSQCHCDWGPWNDITMNVIKGIP